MSGTPESTSTPLPRLAVIWASTRERRVGDLVGRWFVNQAEHFGGFDLDIVDLQQVQLDPVISSDHPKTGRYSPGVQAFANRVAAADAFVFVTPEYNHGYPASLKHALDSIYAEWTLKPAAIVSYGGVVGGVRAAEQLRQVLAELRIHDIREHVVIPLAPTLIAPDGTARDDVLDTAARNLLLELRWWADALRVARQTPFPL